MVCALRGNSLVKGGRHPNEDVEATTNRDEESVNPRDLVPVVRMWSVVQEERRAVVGR
jgi:hypothetical protein